jgi:hypothetical protein
MQAITAVSTTDAPNAPLPITSDEDWPRETPTKYRRYAVNAAMVLGAALVAGSGAIHLHLWLTGYRDIHIIGPLFLAQAISAFVIALAVVVSRRMTSALAAIALLAGTTGGLLFSSWHGVFGFHESLSAPFADLSLFVEGTGIAVLGAASAGCHRRSRDVDRGAGRKPDESEPRPVSTS